MDFKKWFKPSFNKDSYNSILSGIAIRGVQQVNLLGTTLLLDDLECFECGQIIGESDFAGSSSLICKNTALIANEISVGTFYADTGSYIDCNGGKIICKSLVVKSGACIKNAEIVCDNIHTENGAALNEVKFTRQPIGEYNAS